MLQHAIPTAVVKNNVATKNVARQIFPKLPILYLPHVFKILNEDFGIEHWWSEPY
jgi:hypothetical protein